MNFYKHFLGDYARDTKELSILEHGAYRLLLDHYYATGRPLPMKVELLWKICGATSKPERTAIELVINKFFKHNGGEWHNARADEEIMAYERQAATNRAIAQAREAKKRLNEP